MVHTPIPLHGSEGDQQLLLQVCDKTVTITTMILRKITNYNIAHLEEEKGAHTSLRF